MALIRCRTTETKYVYQALLYILLFVFLAVTSKHSAVRTFFFFPLIIPKGKVLNMKSLHVFHCHRTEAKRCSIMFWCTTASQTKPGILLLTASMQEHVLQWGIPKTGSSRLILTSVPYLDNAAFACCRIFSLYIWAARLLYLALVSFVEQPCWRKNDVFKQKEKGRHYIISTNCRHLLTQHELITLN